MLGRIFLTAFVVSIGVALRYTLAQPPAPKVQLALTPGTVGLNAEKSTEFAEALAVQVRLEFLTAIRSRSPRGHAVLILERLVRFRATPRLIGCRCQHRSGVPVGRPSNSVVG